MPLANESKITITNGASSYEVYIAGWEAQFEPFKFERNEWKVEKSKSAPETSGTTPLLVTKFGGGIAQITYGCTNTTVRPVIPDDSRENLIYKRWDKEKWIITGAINSASLVDPLFALGTSHQKLVSKFEHHIDVANGNISITKIVALQSETFSYLTTTGVSVSGTPFQGTISDILITSFQPDITHDIPTNEDGTTSQVLKSFRMTIEKWTLSNASA